jgi:hypothetical protein
LTNSLIGPGEEAPFAVKSVNMLTAIKLDDGAVEVMSEFVNKLEGVPLTTPDELHC